MSKDYTIVEQNCLAILTALKHGQYTRPELDLLQKLFQEIVRVTGVKLNSPPIIKEE